MIEWRGPAPFYYLPVPAAESADIRELAASVSYGWGVIPVLARVGDQVRLEVVDFETSLFPKGGRYLVPLKAVIRRPFQITVGTEVTVELTLRR